MAAGNPTRAAELVLARAALVPPTARAAELERAATLAGTDAPSVTRTAARALLADAVGLADASRWIGALLAIAQSPAEKAGLLGERARRALAEPGADLSAAAGDAARAAELVAGTAPAAESLAVAVAIARHRDHAPRAGPGARRAGRGARPGRDRDAPLRGRRGAPRRRSRRARADPVHARMASGMVTGPQPFQDTPAPCSGLIFDGIRSPDERVRVTNWLGIPDISSPRAGQQLPSDRTVRFTLPGSDPSLLILNLQYDGGGWTHYAPGTVRTIRYPDLSTLMGLRDLPAGAVLGLSLVGVRIEGFRFDQITYTTIGPAYWTAYAGRGTYVTR